MRYVLDASVALKWVLAEPDSAKALQLQADFKSGVHELLAPDVFPIEVAHALARAERRNIIAVGQASPLLAFVMMAPYRFSSSYPLLRRALTIASQARIGVYDCLYVALAEQEGCEFVTADARLTANLQTQFPFIVPLATIP